VDAHGRVGKYRLRREMAMRRGITDRAMPMRDEILDREPSTPCCAAYFFNSFASVLAVALP
jgi:hypothetical protein